MIDIRKLKELVKLMVENDLTELDLQDQEETVSLKRGVGGSVVPAYAVPPAAAYAPAAAAAPGSAAPAQASPAADDGLVAIESPMVGTFYSAANPDSPAFVSVGESINAETVVCLVEAMKVFNEIKAETTGTIARCLVENGEAVEFGQPLFMIKPN